MVIYLWFLLVSLKSLRSFAPNISSFQANFWLNQTDSAQNAHVLTWSCLHIASQCPFGWGIVPLRFLLRQSPCASQKPTLPGQDPIHDPPHPKPQSHTRSEANIGLVSHHLTKFGRLARKKNWPLLHFQVKILSMHADSDCWNCCWICPGVKLANTLCISGAIQSCQSRIHVLDCMERIC